MPPLPHSPSRRRRVRLFFGFRAGILPRGNPSAMPPLPHSPSRRRRVRPFFGFRAGNLPRGNPSAMPLFPISPSRRRRVRPFFGFRAGILPRGNPSAMPLLPHSPSRRRRVWPFSILCRLFCPEKGLLFFQAPPAFLFTSVLFGFGVSAHPFFPVCIQIPFLLLISQFSGLFPFPAVQYLCSITFLIL